MRGFSFTADRRWRLDHLTKSFRFIPSPLRLSLPISLQCTAVTLKVSSIEKCETPLPMHPIPFYLFIFLLQRRCGSKAVRNHNHVQ